MTRVRSTQYAVRRLKSANRKLRTVNLVLVCTLLLTACTGMEKKPDHMELTKVSFSELPGWSEDDLSKVVTPFKKSCEKLLERDPIEEIASDPTFGRVTDWATPCKALEGNEPGSMLEAKKYFETHFVPYRVTNNLEPDGLVTGYYEIEVKANHIKTKEYCEPIYRAPSDMEKPYFTREEIDLGALQGHGLELAYAADPVEVFFMQIQGSGRLAYPDGTTQLIGYDGQNGQEYFAIGKALIEMGEMTKEEVTAPAIMDWLRRNPARMREVMQMNKSYVFFKNLDTEHPLGAQRVELTPERSLAVDKNFIPYGVPLWLVSETPETPSSTKTPIRKLVVAQDTGGAIKGPVRGDYYWGAGDRAAEQAGYMKSPANFYVLIPNAANRPDVVASNW